MPGGFTIPLSILIHGRFIHGLHQADSVKRKSFQAAIAAVFLMIWLAACGDKPEAAFSEEPKGYVEFYMPAARPGEEDIGVDTQIYQIEHGQRVFKGMTRKWSGLSESKRGLTIAAAPGEQSFVIVYDSTEAPVKLQVEQGGYHKVRITMTGLSAEQMIGATRQLRFGLQASVEPSP
jgi:hypothetical protein